MALHDLAYEGQAQPEPAALARRSPGEALEDPLGVVRVEADAVVAYDELDLRTAAAERHPHVAARRRVADGVVQQRADDPPQRRLDARHDARAVRADQRERGRTGLGAGCLGGDQRLHDGREVDGGAPRGPRRELRGQQQVLDHLAELAGVGDDGAQLVAQAAGVRTAGQELGPRVQPGQGRAQLVARVGDEPPLPFERLGQGRDRAPGEQLAGDERGDQAAELGDAQRGVEPAPLLELVPAVQRGLDDGGAVMFGAHLVADPADLVPPDDGARGAQVGAYGKGRGRVRRTAGRAALDHEHEHARRRVRDGARGDHAVQLALGVAALPGAHRQEDDRPDERHDDGHRSGEPYGEGPPHPRQHLPVAPRGAGQPWHRPHSSPAR